MSDGFSSTLANAALNILKGTTPSTYSSVYWQLHTGAPGAAGTSNVSDGSSTRVQANFGSAASGSISLATQPSWTNGSSSETVTDVSAWSAASGGTFILSAQLSSSKAWASGDQLQLSSLSVSIPTAS